VYVVMVALNRALRLALAKPREFRELSATCMRADYSRTGPGAEYLCTTMKGGQP
jgi:hypothetical protein